MTYEEKRQLYLAISQMLADAGLNQQTVREIVEEQIEKKVERAVNQAMDRLNESVYSHDYVAEEINRRLNNAYLNNRVFGDALHYLKEYRDLKETMDWHEEMENIRNNLTNLLMNPALTWEELRQFEGGPVYVKLLGTYEGYPNASRWMLVQSDVSFGNAWFIDRSGARYCFYEKDMNDIWQAFRKEK